MPSASIPLGAHVGSEMYEALAVDAGAYRHVRERQGAHHRAARHCGMAAGAYRAIQALAREFETHRACLGSPNCGRGVFDMSSRFSSRLATCAHADRPPASVSDSRGTLGQMVEIGVV